MFFYADVGMCAQVERLKKKGFVGVRFNPMLWLSAKEEAEKEKAATEEEEDDDDDDEEGGEAAAITTTTKIAKSGKGGMNNQLGRALFKKCGQLGMV